MFEISMSSFYRGFQLGTSDIHLCTMNRIYHILVKIKVRIMTMLFKVLATSNTYYKNKTHLERSIQ